jgi:hypothetical protein
MAFADNWFESECYRRGFDGGPEDEEENDMAAEDADAVPDQN